MRTSIGLKCCPFIKRVQISHRARSGSGKRHVRAHHHSFWRGACRRAVDCLGWSRPLHQASRRVGGAAVCGATAPYPKPRAHSAPERGGGTSAESAAELRRLKARECRRLVVYGAAFGTSFFRRWPNRTLAGARTVKDLHGAHGRCFFKFILKKDVAFVRKRVGTNTVRLPPSLFVRTNLRVEGLDLLVPLDQDALPWLAMASLRRNVKILKMLGPRLFPWTERLSPCRIFSCFTGASRPRRRPS